MVVNEYLNKKLRVLNMHDEEPKNLFNGSQIDKK